MRTQKNDRARSRIICALHEECPGRIVEAADLGEMADAIIASLTADGHITILRPGAMCIHCAGVEADHVANYYCSEFRAS